MPILVIRGRLVSTADERESKVNLEESKGDAVANNDEGILDMLIGLDISNPMPSTNSSDSAKDSGNSQVRQRLLLQKHELSWNEPYRKRPLMLLQAEAARFIRPCFRILQHTESGLIFLP